MDDNLKNLLIGLFVGTMIIGPFIWTRLGRALTEKAIAKGAKVTSEKVSEWAKIGEEEE